MSFTWIIFIACVLYFGFQGYRQGALAALGRILGLVAGYATAFLFVQPVSGIISEHTTIQGFAALIAASLGLFFGASMLVGLIIGLIRKLLHSKQPRSTGLKIAGLSTGVMVGAVFGLAAVFIVSYFRDVYGSVNSGQLKPEQVQAPAPSGVEKMSRQVAGGVASWVTAGMDAEPSVAKMTSLLVTDPATVVGGMQQVLDNPAAKDLFNNPNNQAVLSSNDPGAIAQLSSFKELANNQQIQQLALASGIDTSNQAEFNQALAQQMGAMWGRAQQIKDNPEVQAVLRDPDFQEKVKANNPMALMTDARFMKVVSAIMNTDVSQSPLVNQIQNHTASNLSSSDGQSAEPPKVYRWVDKDGKVHFSDRPRDEIPNRSLQ